MVFQDSRLLPWAACSTTSRSACAVRDAARGAARRWPRSAWAAARRPGPHELSGGEQQRAALARSLVREPELLLADEPFGALDALTRIKMHGLLRKLCAVHRPAVLLVTHDVDEAIVLADRVVVLEPGPDRPRTPGRARRRPRPLRPPTSATCAASCSPRSAYDVARRARPARRPRPEQTRHPHDAQPRAPDPQRLPDEHRPPRGLVAAAGERPVRPPRRRPLPAAGPDRRARQARLGVPRRLPGAVGRHRPPARRARWSRPCCSPRSRRRPAGSG